MGKGKWEKETLKRLIEEAGECSSTEAKGRENFKEGMINSKKGLRN